MPKVMLVILYCLSLGISEIAYTQESDAGNEDESYIPLNDSSYEGQRAFVENLLILSGYSEWKKIAVYQTLPNKARVFRVKLDSVTGVFMFVRWDKKKQENYLDNKMIDPGVYYSLNVAQEILRKQTEKASFQPHDVAIQPHDNPMTISELEELRALDDLREDKERLLTLEKQEKKEPKLNFGNILRNNENRDYLKQKLNSIPNDKALDSIR